MKYHASIEIEASAAKVWKVLTDGARYPEWEPNVTGIDGTIADGQKITVHTRLSDRAFPVTVLLEPERTMTWSGGMPLALFKGVRTFTLREHGGVTTFSMTEVFSGPLRPLMARVMPDLQPSFDSFAAALKQAAEH